MQHLNKYLSQNAVIADHFAMQKWYDMSVYSGVINKDVSIATLYIMCVVAFRHGDTLSQSILTRKDIFCEYEHTGSRTTDASTA